MDWETIWECARSSFLGATATGDLGLLLWEHSARVAQSARKIVSLREVRSSNPDVAAVFAAALFHHSGWILRARENQPLTPDQMLAPLSDTDRDYGATLLKESLDGLLSNEALARGVHAVRASGDRDTDSIEGMVVAEADNLDEFGVLALWSTVRRVSNERHGIQTAIETWQRQREYRFWEARLNDSFRFKPVRLIARKRLARFAVLMEQLAEEHCGSDVNLENSSDLANSGAEVSAS